MDEAATSVRFTVVIPAFNATRTLISAMNSVLRQTVAELELIVVDDGSTDDTRAVALSVDDPRVRVLHQANRGLPGARNTGTREARGPVTCYLDSDDLLMPTYLEVVERALTSDPSADFVYADTWTFDDRTRRIRRTSTAHYCQAPSAAPPTAGALFRELLRANFMPIPVAVRTEVIKEAGLFDETLSAAEDWDMWLRLAVAGHRAAAAPGLLGLRRFHAGQMSRHRATMAKNDVRVLEKLMSDERLSTVDREATAARLAHARRELEIVGGLDRVQSPLRDLRYHVAVLRQRYGLDFAWYRTPPAAVMSVFPDLGNI
jgi:GT2 family glycosyltransferase